MNINFDKISQQNLQKSKDNIFKKIDLLRKEERRLLRRKRIYSGVAASVVFLIVTGLLYDFKTTSVSALDEFVETSIPESLSNDKVELILSSNEKVELEDSTKITYSASGNSVRLSSRAQVSEINTENKISFNTLTVPYGKNTEIQLADGSKVWLNAGSKLIYPNKFDGDHREVYLEGEAIFDVSHSDKKPFLVKTKACVVEVLGTLFDVKSYKEDDVVETTLARGKVRVSYLEEGIFGNKKIQEDLSPGNKAIFYKGKTGFDLETADVSATMSWRDGYIVFKSEPLDEILDKLSRYYNVKFYTSGIINEDARYSGSFYLNDDILNVTKILTSITDHYCYLDAENQTIIIE
ncbi:FecR family protein [Zunongwangia sp. HGR-M22]|uniref:FecR family protein n=1 Tax=Zunongwangia sp. HGR-M22 TaxID=3015168 RepID=UPI0022DE7698|nr:FecR domain-containing protein [Zunongwangia sp. HGR-M22]WBL24345.1 FecR domain-containing protein [Zunongwangia sp. HGR-M22]